MVHCPDAAWQEQWRSCPSGKAEAAVAKEARPGGNHQQWSTGSSFSPSKGAGGGELISGTLKHHPQTLMLPGDKQIQTGFNP